MSMERKKKMTVVYFKVPLGAPIRKLARKRKSKSHTLLQKIASQCNWLVGFMCKDVELGFASHLVLSPHTIKLQCEINVSMQKLRDSIKKDWKAQRRKLTGLDLPTTD